LLGLGPGLAVSCAALWTLFDKVDLDAWIEKYKHPAKVARSPT